MPHTVSMATAHSKESIKCSCSCTLRAKSQPEEKKTSTDNRCKHACEQIDLCYLILKAVTVILHNSLFIEPKAVLHGIRLYVSYIKLNVLYAVQN